jgi:uncharacterized protein
MSTFVPDMSTMLAPLSNALFSRAQAAILGLLYSRADESFYFRQIVATTGLAIGQAQRELVHLVDAGILDKSRQGMHVYFRAAKTCPIFEELRQIVAKIIGPGDILRRALLPLKNRISAAFIFGSVARGTENSASDLDLLIVGAVSFREVVEQIRAAEQSLGRPINPIVYPPREFRDKLSRDHHFLKTVMAGEKIFVLGGPDDLGTLPTQRVDPRAQKLSRRNRQSSRHRRPRHRAKPN